MRALALAALVPAALLLSASAFADEPPPSAPASPAPAAPPPAALAPAYPAPPSYVVPAYPVPYAAYPVAYAGAPYPAPYPTWMGAPPVTERRSNGMRITGISLFAAGGVISAVGGVIFGAVATTGCQVVDASFAEDGGPSPAAAHERVGSARQALNGCDTSPTLGLGLLAAGALTAVAGIPLFVIGSKQVPARPAIGKLVPVVSLGAGNGSLRWTF